LPATWIATTSRQPTALSKAVQRVDVLGGPIHEYRLAA
jgi:hypothetical protein